MEKHKKVRDMYNFIFSLVFVVVTIGLMQLIGINKIEGYLSSVGTLEFVVLSLAVLRLTRLFVYDGITQFVRDWFLDVKPEGDDFSRNKFDSGFKRAVSDILLCPWCLSVWASALLVLAVVSVPGMIYFVYLLAISSVASVLQITSNLIGWHAEGKKNEVTERSGK